VSDLQKLMAKWLHHVHPTILVMAKKPRVKKELKALSEASLSLTGQELKFGK